MRNGENIALTGCFLVFLAFILRLITIFILKFETWEYDVIASNIISGKGYTYRHLSTNYLFFGYPLFPYISAFIRLISNQNYFIFQIIQNLLASFTVLPVVVVTKRLFDYKTAVLSGFLYCIHPGLIVYTTKIHEFTFVVFFLAVLTYLIVCCKINRITLISIGVFIGFGIFLRPLFVFFIPAFFIYRAVTEKGFKSKIIKEVFSITLLVILIISPWIYRGYKIYGRFIFITSNSAEHFWRGNNQMSSGTALTNDNKPIIVVAEEKFQNHLFSLNEIGQYDFFREEAMRYIKSHPMNFLKGAFKKFTYFWYFSPQTGLRYSIAWLAIYKVWYYSLALFFIIGAFFIFKNNKYVDIAGIIFLFSLFIMISVVHSFFYVEIRHRWMIEPFLMTVSSYGAVTLFRYKLRRL